MDDKNLQKPYKSETSPSSSKIPPHSKPVIKPKIDSVVVPPASLKTEESLNLHGDPEINDMLNKMYRMQEDIQSRLGEIYDNAGLSTNQIKTYLNNPNNFSPEIWQKIQSQRDLLEKKILDVLKLYAKKEKKGFLSGPGEISKERRSKTLGARRNWIPM
ncbi:MAG: hypothetical protein BGO14_08915 [Chlamydiales bacterium 38-26]|nr:hypothetical protein [Chlamydiales bacterium]OJV11102.1 MAG: hypothetical protein BGO14_08915 [Chlamydiales bacterium 38-26]